jgi:periplasmic protein TonB
MRRTALTVATAFLLPFLVQEATAQPSAAKSAESTDLKRLKVEQQRLLGQVRREVARLRSAENATTSTEQRQRRVELENLLSEIEQKISWENDPRTKFVEPRRTSDPFTHYYERLVARIERAGSGDFPTRDGKSIYGQGYVRVVVRADGTLELVEVTKSSGDSDIDKHIIGLVRRLEPLEVFPVELSQRADRLVVDTRFRFFNDSK